MNKHPESMREDAQLQMNICPECGADLFKVGVTEATAGGYSETEIRFEHGEAIKGFTDTQNIDEQWAICGNCGARLSDRTAADVIDEYTRRYKPKDLTIDIKTLMLPEDLEKLEDGLRDFLNSKGIEAVIENPSTGNTTVAKGVAI